MQILYKVFEHLRILVSSGVLKHIPLPIPRDDCIQSMLALSFLQFNFILLPMQQHFDILPSITFPLFTIAFQ